METGKRKLKDLPWLPLSLRKVFPPAAAIYFCIDEADCIYYLGRTTNLKTRFVGHHKLVELVALGDLRVHFQILPDASPSQLHELERRYLVSIQPPLNTRG